METALYYTLSTIAQTLAGALAVLVAIVLFNFTRIDDALNTRDSFPHAKILRERGMRGLQAWLKGNGIPFNDEARFRATRYFNAYLARPRLFKALGFTLWDVGFCFVALPFTRAIACSQILSVVVLSSASGLAIICLFFYWKLVSSLVERRLV